MIVNSSSLLILQNNRFILFTLLLKQLIDQKQYIQINIQPNKRTQSIITLQKMSQQTDPFAKDFNDIQNILMTIRRVQLALGSLILFFIIISIIRKKLYVYNTTKLFMWFCICYFIGMLAVCPHYDYLSGGYKYAYTEVFPDAKQHYLLNILQKMKQDNSLYWCGLEAFINLYAYDFGYFFAVLVSFNVFCVINGNYRNFMRKVFTNIKVIIFLIFMFIMYFIPLLLIFITDDFQNHYYYSYTPMGFQYKVTIAQTQRSATLLFFAGFNNRPNSLQFQILKMVNLYLCPFLMLIVHSILLILNKKKINKFYHDDYLNSKQQFLIKSGSLGSIVFLIQGLHFFKLLLGLVSFISWWYMFILVLNFIFDCYPLLLLFFYFRYTKQKIGISGSSTILEEGQQENQD